MREAHLRDAVALCEFICWLEDEVLKKGNTVTEVEVRGSLVSLLATHFLIFMFVAVIGVKNLIFWFFQSQPGRPRLRTTSFVVLKGRWNAIGRFLVAGVWGCVCGGGVAMEGAPARPHDRPHDRGARTLSTALARPTAFPTTNPTTCPNHPTANRRWTST
jgi:hypothetical protein